MTRQIDLILIGGSAGGFSALSAILPQLPAGFPIPVLIVLHRNSRYESGLIELFNIKSQLSVKEVEEKEQVSAPAIYLAPADYHVLIEKDHTFSLDYSEKVHFCRPSIDVSFQSAAQTYRERLAGVILSGSNSDGADGLAEIKSNGGLAIIQDTIDAEVAYMPRQAMKKVAANVILTAREIGLYLSRL